MDVKIANRNTIISILQKSSDCTSLNLSEVIQHPHNLERGSIRALDDPFIGQFPVPGQPPLFSSWNYSNELTAPLLGEHNHEVLTRLAGLKEKEIYELERQHIIVSDKTSRSKKNDMSENYYTRSC